MRLRAPPILHQYKTSGEFAVAYIDVRLLCKRYAESDIVTKDRQHLVKNLLKMIFTSELLLRAGQKNDDN